MKMKLTILMVLLLLIGAVSAQSTPNPIAVKINTAEPEGCIITISNLVKGESVTGITNGAGEFITNWDYSTDYNDVFEVEVSGIKHTQNYEGTRLKPIPLDLFTFDVTLCSKDKTTPIGCPTCQVTECGSCGGSTCSYSEERCREKYPNMIVTNTVYDCENNDLIDEYIGKNPDVCDGLVEPEIRYVTKIDPNCPKEECPEQNDTITNIIIAIASLVLGTGAGLKIYEKRTGGASVTHRHIGIRGYHDPNTLHNDIKIRHPRMDYIPVYTVDGVYIPKKK